MCGRLPGRGYPRAGIASAHATRTLNRVTYEGAKRWLAETGGTWEEVKESTRMRCWIIVSARTALGATVQRHAAFDDTLATRFERRMAVRAAFVRACEELKAALE